MQDDRRWFARGRLGAGDALGLATALGVALELGCAQPAAPPPRMAEGEKPAASASAPAATVEYPATPERPPPVAEPAGQGASVKLQRYITVDQFGYRPDLTKIAVLVDPEQGWNGRDSYQPEGDFEVRRWSDGGVAFTARVTAWNEGKLDANSGDRGYWFNFTKLKEPGLYYVYDPKNQVRSHPFEIGEDVYDRVLKTALRMFYFNRANFDLPNRIFGNPNFGRIFSAKSPREMQFGVRFAF